MQAKTHIKQFETLKFTLYFYLISLSVSLSVIQENAYRWILFLCLFFLRDERLSKIEYFLFHREKCFIYQCLPGPCICRWLLLEHFTGFLCHWPLCRFVKFLKYSNIKWILINCLLFTSRNALERWQAFAIFQREDKRFESLASARWWWGVCKTWNPVVNIRTFHYSAYRNSATISDWRRRNSAATYALIFSTKLLLLIHFKDTQVYKQAKCISFQVEKWFDNLHI